MGRFVALVVTCALLASCGGDPRVTTPEISPGPQVHTMATDDGPRQYRTYVPRKLAGEPALVVVLHGLGGTASAASHFGWNALADKHGFVVAYPQGVGNSWNAGGTCCGAAAQQGVDDISFVQEVASKVAEDSGVDPRRTYLYGRSNGAILAYAIQCRGGSFAAIAPVSGTQVGDCPTPSRTSVIHIHGAKDPVVRLNGQLARMAFDGLPVRSAVDGWRGIDDCEPFAKTLVARKPAQVAACADGRAVELVVLPGEAHIMTTGFDVEEAWKFFRAHPAPHK